MFRRSDVHRLNPSCSSGPNPAPRLEAIPHSRTRPRRARRPALGTRHFYRVGLSCLLLAGALPTRAQAQRIEISDSLAANAEALKVKMGPHWIGKVWRYQFGDYVVEKGSSSRTNESTTPAAAPGTRPEDIEQRTHRKRQDYSFALRDKAGNVATIEASNYVSVEELKTVFRTLKFLSPGKWLESGDLLPWEKEVHWDPDESADKIHVFSAVITTGVDDPETWALFMALAGPEEVGQERKASLSNGKREIEIIATSSNKLGTDPRDLPALGWQFIEDQRALCALQYDGGGLIGALKKTIWIDSRLDPRTKLVLAAAMTSLLQIPGIGPPG